MARSLTRAQLNRRGHILKWLKDIKVLSQGSRSTQEVRRFLAHHHRTFVTEDTIAKDLKAMVKVGSLEMFKSGRESRWNATAA